MHSPVVQTVHRGGFGHHHLWLAEMLRLPLLLLGGDLRLHVGSEMSAAADDTLTIGQPLGAVGRQRGIVVALAAAAFAVIHRRPADQPASAPAAASPVPVVTAQVQQHDEPIVLSGIGTVQALNTASIQSQVTGVLEEVDFVEGQTVKKRGILAKIDPLLFEAALEHTQGQLAKDTALHAQAQSDLARFQTLGRQDSIALQQVADPQFLVAQDAAAKSDQKRPDAAGLHDAAGAFRWRDRHPADPNRQPDPTKQHDRHRGKSGAAGQGPEQWLCEARERIAVRTSRDGH